VTGFLDLLTLMTLNDFEPTNVGFLANVFSKFLASVHISKVNCDEMAGDRPRQPSYDIFNIKRRF